MNNQFPKQINKKLSTNNVRNKVHKKRKQGLILKRIYSITSKTVGN
jgi:hypothetical protein